MMRLNLFLARAGVAARRKCDRLIFDGRVTVNGKVAESPGLRVDEAGDDVRLDGERVFIDERHYYFMLNKPPNYLTTVKDPFGRPTVMDLLKSRRGDIPRNLRLFPVGRLDKDSRGLLLLTNDGDFAQELLHPGKKVVKVYRVLLSKRLTAQDKEMIERGLELGDGRGARAKIRASKTTPEGWLVEVAVVEGRKRLVRRIFSTLGYEVLDLQRIAIGKLKLKNFAEGEFIELSREEARLALESDQVWDDNNH